MEPVRKLVRDHTQFIDLKTAGLRRSLRIRDINLRMAETEKDFEDAMYKEAKHLFDNEMWEKFVREEMIAYNRDLMRQGINVKRK
eukprot:5290359-Ditylum_brightwellii.AAC.2